MFKSLQIKLVTIFVLLVLAIMSVAGTFLVLRVSVFYHNSFVNNVSSVFKNIDFSNIQDVKTLNKTIKAKSADIEISNFRNYYIINSENGEVVYGSAVGNNEVYIDSPNYLKALSGEVSKRVDLRLSFMDYAKPVKVSDGEFIIYIKDTKEEFNDIIKKIVMIILQAIIFSIVAATFAGYFIARNITTPISNLTKCAKKISEGEFDAKIDTVKSNDEIGMLTESFRDMSGRLQKTISEVSTEKNKMEAVIQNMTDGVIAFSKSGKIIHINSTAKKMLNVDKIEKYKFDKLFEELQADIKIGDLLYLEGNRSCEREITRDELTLKINFEVFDNEKNKTDGVLSVLHDVTKQQRLEMSRREFVANVSHELKTPLTTIKSHAETLLDVIGENKTAETFTNTILNETDRMTRLVKDLLLISSLEGKIVLNKTMFSLKDMINDVVSTMSLVANEKGHRLQFEAVAEIPEFYGDRDKLEQVLYNIISNSIKYTPNGGKINIKAGKLYGEFFVEVSDNGIGIPENDLERIFERFYRVDKARSRELGGTGLGLSISKGIIDAHGGTIKVSSEVGNGTKVIIFLPVSKNK
jgi:two-component system sensor histidine kinase VicK